jgi:phosphohistidine phosphatase SixA
MSPMPTAPQPECIILVRHGKVDRSESPASSPLWPRTRTCIADEERPLSPDGRTDVEKIGAVLAEYVRFGHGPDLPRLDVRAILVSEYKHALETRDIMLECLPSDQRPKLCTLPELKPETFWSTRVQGVRDLIKTNINPRLCPADGKEASSTEAIPTVIVVGHMPQLGWLAGELLRRPFRLARQSSPIPRGVALAIRTGGPWWRQSRVWWTLSPDGKQATADVREKIRGKMQSAQALSAVITLGLSAALGLAADPDKLQKLLGAPALVVSTRGVRACDVCPLDPPSAPATVLGRDVIWELLSTPHPTWALWGAAAGLLLSLALYLAAFFAYDQLLMPEYFWSERLGRGTPWWVVHRPPSSGAWLLFQNMQHVWFRLFVPATFLLIFGLAAFAALVLQAANLLFGLGAALVIAAVLAWRWRHRPRLGAED